MNSTAMPPLVSVVVRTMGRPTLQRALACIGAQTHRPLEIVLVDAADQGLKIARQGDLPVRVVGGGPHDRPHAANAGLAVARGAWLLFLDEDDEIAPGHVAQLVATAAVSGGCCFPRPRSLRPSPGMTCWTARNGQRRQVACTAVPTPRRRRCG